MALVNWLIESKSKGNQEHKDYKVKIMQYWDEETPFISIGWYEPSTKIVYCLTRIISKRKMILDICLLALESMTRDGDELVTHATLPESTNVTVEEGSVVCNF